MSFDGIESVGTFAEVPPTLADVHDALASIRTALAAADTVDTRPLVDDGSVTATSLRARALRLTQRAGLMVETLVVASAEAVLEAELAAAPPTPPAPDLPTPGGPTVASRLPGSGALFRVSHRAEAGPLHGRELLYLEGNRFWITVLADGGAIVGDWGLVAPPLPKGGTLQGFYEPAGELAAWCPLAPLADVGTETTPEVIH